METFGPLYLPALSCSLASKLIAKHERLGWPGLLGSLDCSHWTWAKCPKSWQGDFKRGDLEHPTIVYECACDADLFIFHCNFAAPGANSDINVCCSFDFVTIFVNSLLAFFQVLDSSPILESIALGKTMSTFVIESNSYFQPYLLVDGIYPKFTCFVGPCSNPVTVAESNFARRQESQRKDIERAFGALQIKYKIILMLYHVPSLIVCAGIIFLIDPVWPRTHSSCEIFYEHASFCEPQAHTRIALTQRIGTTCMLNADYCLVRATNKLQPKLY
jgi:hypothetical protein